MRKKKVISIVIILVLLLVSACSSTTVINSDPKGAQLYLNGEKVGVTPYTHKDTKTVGSTNTVLLKKKGYEDFTTAFSRNEEVNVGAIIGGVLVLFPFLWAMDYKPTHNYEMVSLEQK